MGAVGRMGLAVLLFGRLSAILLWLAAVGRMALTNYLMQSVIMTVSFYGLGLYGNASVGLAVAVMAAIWVLEFSWSRSWLACFPYSLAEWLWRRLTYGRRPAPAKYP